ncbi:MAG: putative Histidinol-phosphate aminotransferase [Promethearchaeota archaeon]|nr:MAG: putative Histidinol-phosphate aminotransferase [Candidatus Lokiarchaeota archaeon]
MKNIRLDKNEMPFLPPKTVQVAIYNSLKSINRYTPTEKVELLLELLSSYSTIEKERIILSAGSDILIKEFIFRFSHVDQIIIANPTFIIIQNSALQSDSELLKVRLSEPHFTFPTKLIENQITKPTLLVLDNPNNPSGKRIVTEDQLGILLKKEMLTVLIDEAYFEFSGNSVLPLIKRYPNIAITRTLSKAFGLAGIGLGYMLAGETIVEAFEGLDIMLPYPSVMGAISALQNKDYMEEFVEFVHKEKQTMIERLQELDANYYESETNFLLITTGIQNIAQRLAEKSIYVCPVSDYFGSDSIRVSIGTHQENTIFLEALQKLLSQK